MNENEIGIIINDIDVTACNSIKFGFNVCECGVQGVEYYNMRCSYNPDCYYKQLQREKQKNKELTEDFNEICKRHNEAFEEFLKLKEENEKMGKPLKEIEVKEDE